MKVTFVLKNITGSSLSQRFAAAIKEEGVGYEDGFGSSAALSEDGRTWITYHSGFRYEILNPEAEEPAIVEYIGGWRGFLAQDLLPAELRGETTHAVISEGSAVERHEVPWFEYTDAGKLVEAYGLMQTAAHRPADPNHEPLKMAIAAVEAARQVHQYMMNMGLRDASFVRAGPARHGHACTNTNDGDPAVFVTCCPGGEQVTLEIQVHPWGNESTPEWIARRANDWLNRLRPVLYIAA